MLNGVEARKIRALQRSYEKINIDLSVLEL